MRLQYQQSVQAMSREVLLSVERGLRSAKDGAEFANGMRNEIMEVSRLESSDLGRAVAEAKKKSGATLEKLLQKYSHELYQRDFTLLGNEAERGEVYLTVIKKSGAPSKKMMAAAGHRSVGEARQGRFGPNLSYLCVQHPVG